MAHIYLSSPHMSEEGYEQAFIKEAFDTNWIAPLGKNVNEFEKELAAYVGAKDAAALSAGTAAIHLALKAAGVGEGDVVFCQVCMCAFVCASVMFVGGLEDNASRHYCLVVTWQRVGGFCWMVPLLLIPA